MELVREFGNSENNSISDPEHSDHLEPSDSTPNNHLSNNLSNNIKMNLSNNLPNGIKMNLGNNVKTNLGDESDFDQSGIVYISRIPPFMGLSKLRSYFSNFGAVGKIYCHPESITEYNKRIKSGGNRRLKFTHGWVQFTDKKVAKQVAKMLNNKPVEDKRHSFWREDLWNIKYLPKFKWRHLVEYWSNTKRERKEKLHSVLAKERKRNLHYLEQLEQEKVEQHIEQKKGKNELIKGKNEVKKGEIDPKKGEIEVIKGKKEVKKDKISVKKAVKSSGKDVKKDKISVKKGKIGVKKTVKSPGKGVKSVKKGKREVPMELLESIVL
ncbi:Pre-rRNA-processing protein esf-2 [Theileria parva strain Muguga]|uniref:RRM domain-containing protein n=1 Tax=Theileria parva TaxID=5875 RepID=Q4N905_THEPA|nr:Pre-rRNA-processing protein esf-2 [Theileria parva strain Muguga]EAN33553.1 Pre-rRNA-processing protein esf-2 [Theileria parva strain Muguga]|eukprot:XP_765836.1 hypothetical protein [Theileria parva strain Muguga]